MTTTPAQARTGLARLLTADRPPFRGERLGLLTHPAAVTPDARHAVPALLDAGADLRALFGPEHGFRGTAQAGSAEARSIDPTTGLPVYDTYLATLPALRGMVEEAGIDVLAVDLQHVGARFFTYEASLYDAIAATAGTGTRIAVLDRPNPLGGVVVQGPVLEPAFSSFVGREAIPLRHGMTLGELAGLFAQRLGAEPPEVVELRDWSPSALLPATGLPWVPPSPNLPTPAAALCYPGTCLLEGVELSVGRGTTTPFELLGAPWLDGSFAAELRALDLPGVLFREVWTTPSFDAHAGERICGVQFHVTDPQAFDPLAAGLAVLTTLRAGWPDRLVFKERIFDLLAGTDRLRRQILAGQSHSSILASFHEESTRFATVDRLPHLRYPRD